MKIAVVENEEKDIQVYKEYISKYQESTKERIEAVFFKMELMLSPIIPKN